MIRRFVLLCTVLCTGWFADSLKADNYLWLTNSEYYSDGVRGTWYHYGYDGVIRSNDTVFSHCPFGDVLITSATITAPDSQIILCPQFAVRVVEHADSLPWPTEATLIRQWAQEQGNFFPAGDNARARVVIQDHVLRITWGVIGVPFDTTQFSTFALEDSSVVFFDCPVDVSGTVSGVLIFGASGDVGLETDIRYSCIGEDNYLGYPIPADCSDKFALVSESSVLVLNTVANGRDNSNGEGMEQQNPAFTDIVLTGFVCALGSHFTFDQQNDPNDEYQGPSPDRRGIVCINGGLMQNVRGYFMRANHSGTGYGRDLLPDVRLRDWDFGVYDNSAPSINPSHLSFPETSVGDTTFEIVDLTQSRLGVNIDSFESNSPFFVESIEDITDGQRVTVGFAPTMVRNYAGTMDFHTEYTITSVSLSGIGSADLASDEPIAVPSSLELSVYPNPFNATTTIHYELPSDGFVNISILDVTGRLTEILSSGVQTAGKHMISWSPADLASGVYFCKVETQSHRALQKLVLLK